MAGKKGVHVRRAAFIIGIAGVILIAVVSILQTPLGTPPSVGPTPVSPVAWHRVATWSGDDFERTDLFQIASRNWRVEWRTNDVDEEANYFSVWAYNADGTRQMMVASIANSDATGEVAGLNEGPGPFYLEISPHGVVWTVTVEEQR
jgi:hypothetical protein